MCYSIDRIKATLMNTEIHVRSVKQQLNIFASKKMFQKLSSLPGVMPVIWFQVFYAPTLRPPPPSPSTCLQCEQGAVVAALTEQRLHRGVSPAEAVRCAAVTPVAAGSCFVVSVSMKVCRAMLVGRALRPLDGT